jgi:hypothetical protein
MHRPGGTGGGTSTTEDELRLAGQDRLGDSRQVAGIQRRIAVAEADDLGGGRARPVWQAAPKPRLASDTTATPWLRAFSADRSVEPLSTTIPR